MLLLTGATGLLGHEVVRRLTARGTPVRCLVRDPRRLGPERVRVQLAIGDLADPASWRNALRGVDTVVHLAGGARDQPRATVEELNGLAAWRLLRAAERVGARHFLWITPLGATPHHPMRMQRAKALAAAAIAESSLATTTLAHSLIYAPGDRHLRWLERLGFLPAVPLVGRGIARTQPLWAADAADCLIAALDRPPRRRHARPLRAGRAGDADPARGRAARARRLRPPPPRAAAPADRPARRAAGRGDARRPDLPDHLGRGAAARGRDADRARDRGRRDARRPARAGWPTSYIDGRWCAHGCAASICAATCSSTSSLSGLPTICTPVGSPSAPKPTGSEIAGWPVTLNSDV